LWLSAGLQRSPSRPPSHPLASATIIAATATIDGARAKRELLLTMNVDFMTVS
jgi:hypothetical protein